MMGEFKSVSFMKSANNIDFWASKPTREQGILLRSLRDLYVIPRSFMTVYRIERRMKERIAVSIG